MSIKLIVDSAADFTAKEARELGIKVLPLRVNFGGKEYLDKVDISNEEFYEKLKTDKEFPKTSQIPPYEYEEAFGEFVKDGHEVICLVISSKLSGCFQSANIAADAFDGKVTVVDTENVCVGEKILAELAAALIDQGYSAKDIVKRVEEQKKNVRLIARLDTLEYLKKGGRISSAVALAGGLLSIKPVIAIQNGEIAFLGQARGSKAANNKLTGLIEEEGGINYFFPYALAYSGTDDTELKKYISSQEKIYSHFAKAQELPVTSIGSVIGTHAGPGAIAAAFFVYPKK